MKMRIRLLLISCVIGLGLSAQVTIDNTSQTVEQFVQNVLLGGGVTISNVQFNGGSAAIVNEQVGEFTDPNSDVGFSYGLILGSGDVQMASQPNTGGGNSAGGTGQTGNDADLQSITPNQIYDECVIEFDFVPSGDTISFQYTFASEEYPEYVCGTVNDAFGFFLTGNNPAGGTYNATNIALVPDPANPGQYTTTPVSINTVNPGTAGTNGSASNCDAIDPNWSSYSVFYTTNSTGNYEYDGRTVTLTAVAAVNCGEIYHIKLAIGDGGDPLFDSGVFLEGNSFNSSGLSIVASTTTVYEGCPGAYYILTRPDTSVFDTISLAIQGSATNGTDYAYIDSMFVFGDTNTTDTLWLDVFATDGDTNLYDTVEIFINETNACGGPIIVIIQADPLMVSITPGDTICTQDPINDSCLMEPTISGGVPGGHYFQWNTHPPYSWGPGEENDSTVILIPDDHTYITLTIYDACGSMAESQSEFIYLECLLTIPNIFTPNGDGDNDYFFIENIDHYPNNILIIYNRWGRVVFEATGYNNDWDGGEFSDGVYFYVLYPNGNTREKEPYSGTVHIVNKQ